MWTFLKLYRHFEVILSDIQKKKKKKSTSSTGCQNTCAFQCKGLINIWLFQHNFPLLRVSQRMWVLQMAKHFKRCQKVCLFSPESQNPEKCWYTGWKLNVPAFHFKSAESECNIWCCWIYTVLCYVTTLEKVKVWLVSSLLVPADRWLMNKWTSEQANKPMHK